VQGWQHRREHRSGALLLAWLLLAALAVATHHRSAHATDPVACSTCLVASHTQVTHEPASGARLTIHGRAPPPADPTPCV